LLEQEFDTSRFGDDEYDFDDCVAWQRDLRLLFVADRMLEPRQLYRFSFWLPLDRGLCFEGLNVFASFGRERFFLFCQARKGHSKARKGWGRLSYFVMVPEHSMFAMLPVLRPCTKREGLFAREYRSAEHRRKHWAKARRYRRATI
jgi:hypothetical protein